MGSLPGRSLGSVLIVDDEPAVRKLMSHWVIALGLEADTAATADEALERLRARPFDLAVIDVMMPGHDGLWLANELRRSHPHTAVVIASGFTDLVAREAGSQPIADFLPKPCERERFVLAIDRGRQWRRQALQDVEWRTRLAGEVREITATVCAELRRRAESGTAEADALTAIVDERMPDVTRHGDRVARYAQAVAREVGRDWPAGSILDVAARFHDVGKIAMPEALLTKPSALTADEQAIMRRHVDAGADILSSTRELHEAAALVLTTHEWFNGGGYPLKLAGSTIPLASRIIATVDAYDTMIEGSGYRPAFNAAEAIAELQRCAGTQFDPQTIDALVAVLARQ
jgi:putative two-component system response regulator